MKTLLIITMAVLVAAIVTFGIIIGNFREHYDYVFKAYRRVMDNRYDYMRDSMSSRVESVEKDIAELYIDTTKLRNEISSLKDSETNFKKDIATLFQYNQSGKNSIYGMHDIVESINCDLKHVKEKTDKNYQVIMQIMLANLPEDMRDDLYDLKVDPMTGKVTAVTKYDTEMTLEEMFAKKNTSKDPASTRALTKELIEKRKIEMRKAEVASEAKKKKGK